jgi:hypothetical protein
MGADPRGPRYTAPAGPLGFLIVKGIMQTQRARWLRNRQLLYVITLGVPYHVDPVYMRGPSPCHWPACKMPDGTCDEGRQCLN